MGSIECASTYCHDDECIIMKVTKNGICPKCGGKKFTVEGSNIICTAPGGCTWTYDFEELNHEG